MRRCNNRRVLLTMRYSLKQTTPPAVEPLTLAEAKLHVRVDSAGEDTLIESYITAARQMAEAYTGRQLITATSTLESDDFPGAFGDINLPRTPLGSVSSVAYVDGAGSTQTLSTDIYEVLDDDVKASVVLKPGKVWPEVQSEKRNAVTITFTAGYGAAASDVPGSVRSALLLIVANLYENRESVITGTNATTLPMGVTALLDTVSVHLPV